MERSTMLFLERCLPSISMAIDPGIPTDFIGGFIPKPSSYASHASVQGIQGALHRLPGSHRIICCNSLSARLAIQGSSQKGKMEQK